MLLIITDEATIAEQTNLFSSRASETQKTEKINRTDHERRTRNMPAFFTTQLRFVFHPVKTAGVSRSYTTTSDCDVYPPSRRRRWRCEGIVERGCIVNHRDANEMRRDATPTRPDPTRPDATVRDGRYAFAMRAAV